MTDNSRTVAVVGGGIGGLTVALVLSRLGHRVTLFEKYDRTSDVGAGLLLAPNGLAVFDALGLGPDLRHTGSVVHHSAVRRADGTVIMPLSFAGGTAGLDHVVAISRQALHGRLWEALLGDGLVRVRTGVAVTAVESEGVVSLGDSSRPETYELVVGADGVRSLVRAGGRFGGRVTSTGETYVRGLVRARGAVDLEGEYWTRLGVFGGASLRQDLTYFYASANRLRTAVDEHDLETFRGAWVAAVPGMRPVLEAIYDFSDLLVTPVDRVDCTTWVDGRTVLLGDAAHAMAPTLGQGANSAVVDAAVLGQELAVRDLPDALLAYQDRRLPAVRRVQDTSDRIAGASAASGHVRTWLRDRVLALASGSACARERQLRLVNQEYPAALRRDLATLFAAAV